MHDAHLYIAQSQNLLVVMQRASAVMQMLLCRGIWKAVGARMVTLTLSLLPSSGRPRIQPLQLLPLLNLTEQQPGCLPAVALATATFLARAQPAVHEPRCHAMLPSSASSMLKGTSCVQHAHERAVLRVLHLVMRLLDHPRNGPRHVRLHPPGGHGNRLHMASLTLRAGQQVNRPRLRQVSRPAWRLVCSSITSNALVEVCMPDACAPVAHRCRKVEKVEGCTCKPTERTASTRGPPTSPQTVCATPHSSWSLSEMKNSFVLGIMHTCPFLHAHCDWKQPARNPTVQCVSKHLRGGNAWKPHFATVPPSAGGMASQPGKAALQEAIGGPRGALRRGLLAPVEPAVRAAAPLCQRVHQANSLWR